MQSTSRPSLIQALLLLGSSLSLLVAFSLSTPSVLVSSSRSMMAQVVGMSAGVQPNEYNTLATQLAQKEEELKTREARVVEIQSNSSQSNATLVATLSLGLSVVLFLLLILNFYFDMRARRDTNVNGFSLDLRKGR